MKRPGGCCARRACWLCRAMPYRGSGQPWLRCARRQVRQPLATMRGGSEWRKAKRGAQPPARASGAAGASDHAPEGLVISSTPRSLSVHRGHRVLTHAGRAAAIWAFAPCAAAQSRQRPIRIPYTAPSAACRSAPVAELVDATDLKSVSRKGVQVRSLSGAPGAKKQRFPRFGATAAPLLHRSNAGVGGEVTARAALALRLSKRFPSCSVLHCVNQERLLNLMAK